MFNTPQPECRRLGTTTIQLHDDEFMNGYQAGHMAYGLDVQAKLLTDHDLYAFLSKHLLSVFSTDRFRAGYISGWYAGLYGHRLSFQVYPHTATDLQIRREQA